MSMKKLLSPDTGYSFIFIFAFISIFLLSDYFIMENYAEIEKNKTAKIFQIQLAILTTIYQI